MLFRSQGVESISACRATEVASRTAFGEEARARLPERITIGLTVGQNIGNISMSGRNKKRRIQTLFDRRKEREIRSRASNDRTPADEEGVGIDELLELMPSQPLPGE